jgi:trehalose synthase
MGALRKVMVGAFPLERFRPVVGDEAYREVERGILRAQELFAGRAIWNINSTARGGGVAELLRSLLAYGAGAGVDMRWDVIGGNRAFFEITKRIHNRLHGAAGDAGELGPREHEIYEETLAENCEELGELVRSEDIVFLHDPQTAGMVDAVRETGATCLWRCHVGLDLPNAVAREAWAFLRPYVENADGFVFSRREFTWEGLDPDQVWIVPPSIDAFSPKNQELAPEAVHAITQRIGITEGPAEDRAIYTREDGSPGRVDRRAELDQDGPVPEGAPLVTQISRWDRLKDPTGVLAGFSERLDGSDAHLVLAGPAVDAVSDDPEGAEVLAEVHDMRSRLPRAVAARVHLASLPMTDAQENAAMVNALQRRSDIIVQKSIAEGFGLTVAEAMWKSRPVIASGLGGIQDQIVDGESGVLLSDPRDLGAFATALTALLDDRAERERLGAAARKRIETAFLGPRHLIQYLGILEQMMRQRG